MRVRIARSELETSQSQEVVIGIRENRSTSQGVSRGDCERLVGIALGLVTTLVIPRAIDQRGWIERVVVLIEDREGDLAIVGESGGLAIGSEKIVAENELRLDVEGLL